jgi:hypothetical protein
MPEPTPEAWAQIRHDYENTGRPLAHICAEHDVTIPTVRYRMKLWQWRRRKPLVPRQGPPAVSVEAIEDLHPPLEGEGRRAASQARCEPGWGDARVQQLHPTPLRLADASRSDPPPPGESEIVPRLQSAVARVLPAIEATIARLAAGPHHPRAMEQAGRTLSSLTRTLRELNALLAEHNARPAGQCDCMPEDMDAYRAEMVRRIQTFLESRAKQDFKRPEAG